MEGKEADEEDGDEEEEEGPAKDDRLEDGAACRVARAKAFLADRFQ